SICTLTWRSSSPDAGGAGGAGGATAEPVAGAVPGSSSFIGGGGTASSSSPAGCAWSSAGSLGHASPRTLVIDTAVVSLATHITQIPRPTMSSALRSEEHTSELQSHLNLVCRLLLEKKKKTITSINDDR